MITVLNYCHTDRDQALNLLRWIGQLGGVSNHEIILQSNQQVLRDGTQNELIVEAKKHFGNVEHFTPFTEDERGWPQSPNHGWLEAVIHMRELFAKRAANSVLPAWLWLEPDCVPIKSNWLDALEAEYKEANKGFLAAEVTHPRRRLSGVALYPAIVSRYLRHRRLGDLSTRSDKGDAWDAYYSPEWIEFTHFTKLIQQMHWHSPEVAPTFPDQDSLSIIHPETLLWHRCKDGTLIERLQERIIPALPPVVEVASEVERKPVYTPPPAPEPVIDEEKELMRAKIKEMEAKLAVTVTHVGGNRYGGKKKKVRTLEEVARDKERMARARAGRKPKEAAV